MSDTSHRDLAAVLPYAEPVLVSPPLIPLWRGHGSTFPLCSGSDGTAGTSLWSKFNARCQARSSVDAAQRRFRARGAGGRLCPESGWSVCHERRRKLMEKVIDRYELAVTVS